MIHKVVLLIAVLIITMLPVTAQKIVVKESAQKIGGKNNNALEVTIYEAEQADIEKAWKSEMKKYDAKISTKDGVFADNAIIKSFGSNNTVDIYALTEKIKEGEIRFVVAFDLGGMFLSSSKHPEQYKEANKIVKEFAIKMTKEAIAGQLKAAEKTLDKLADEHKDLVENQQQSEKDIEEYKSKIKKAEDSIAKSKSDQETKQKEIEAQKKIVDAIKVKEQAAN